ncbi:hypothetical protein MA16_Dca027507 [Dendrobium catenatum]|uniref:Uncharacterized protein n=1 Tax=Dendrobium catenatum TaxID=906689 RepID=A0A2I0WE94_9ASPA|nr:hypothetical protein MA16_Dca027507 [Dendrobium catenatum]
MDHANEYSVSLRIVVSDVRTEKESLTSFKRYTKLDYEYSPENPSYNLLWLAADHFRKRSSTILVQQRNGLQFHQCK